MLRECRTLRDVGATRGACGGRLPLGDGEGDFVMENCLATAKQEH